MATLPEPETAPRKGKSVSSQKETRGAWLNTGIKLLNDLLTRDVKRGIAVPTTEEFASSITVIKGAAGAGKSVLSAIISNNLHGEIVTDGKQSYLPIAVYFSYTQTASGIYRYLEEIIPSSALGPKWLPPLIASPKHPFGITEWGGISALRRSLVETLSPFRPLPFEPYPKSDTSAGTEKKDCIERFLNSDQWNVGKDRKDLKLETLQNRFESGAILVPFVVIDPINFFFDYRDSRAAVAELFATFRVLRWPLVVTLEDVGTASRPEHRQLSSYVEFEADTVIELVVRSEQHIRRTIEVKKSRNSQPRFGQQMYRIEKPDHGFSNIMQTDHPGFMIFPSIHWVLSHSYDRPDITWGRRTGISTFDKILENKAPSVALEEEQSVERCLLPEDAFIVVRGEKGGHKLPISFNILAAGLWDTPSEGNLKKVLLLSLGEEMNLSLSGIALSEREFSPLHLSTAPQPDNTKDNTPKDNARLIKFFDAPETLGQSENKKQFKVMISRWKVKLLETGSTSEMKEPPTLIEATFKPGYLTPDEFLGIVETLLAVHKPSRILVENTSHLRMRFPDLHAEKMLFPALGCLARSKRMMLIVTDVLGRGCDRELSYGLAAGADFVVEVESVTEREHTFPGFIPIRDKIETQLDTAPDGASQPFVTSWSKMSVSNVRAKNYRRARLAATVFRPKYETSNHARLFMADVTGPFTASKRKDPKPSPPR